MGVSRRDFLVRGSASVGLGFAGLQRLCAASAREITSMRAKGFGPLVRDPRRVLDLPEGFSYRVISRFGDAMDDGLMVPGQADGMASFAVPNGTTVLVRNHELEPHWVSRSGFGLQGERVTAEIVERGFDMTGEMPSIGGTTTVHYDHRKGEVLGQWMSLAGTNRNCAGGPTPWGSWLTCEEDVMLAGDKGAEDHGWVFEVPAGADGVLHKAEPIRAMGRFYREAVAVDPVTGIVYMTEDLPDAAFYRYIPNTPGKLNEGGRVQALRVRGSDAALDTRNWMPGAKVVVGTKLSIEWVDLDDVESPKDDLRHRAHNEHGCAVFARTEGIWEDGGVIYVGCTSGGRERLGQIWKYIPSAFEGTDREAESPARLELFIEPNDSTLVKNADNLVMSPWGDLIVCEDSAEDQHLVGVTPEGRLYTFGHNVLSDSEFAGACFSPDGRTMFVNIQYDGLTVAIDGPWDRRGG